VQWDEEGDGVIGRAELLAPTSSALRETDPVVIGVGRCNNVDTSEGHVRPEHRALIGERHTYPPHHGAPLTHRRTIGLLAAATGQRGRSTTTERVRRDKEGERSNEGVKIVQMTTSLVYKLNPQVRIDR
jgi:hypothetical protein